MAAVCAVHCLLTPILVIALPIIATSVFVHEDFHLWMILLVLPTTSFAVFMGCRKHKDRWVAILSVIGLSVLVVSLVYERMHHAAHIGVVEPTHAEAWFNTLGGLLLASAHVRNYRLCRKSHCEH